MKGYNGWTNYETWNVNLWINGDEPSYYYWKEAARRSESVQALADQLSETHKTTAPELQGPYSDLLANALNRVNWYEIAEALRQGANE